MDKMTHWSLGVTLHTVREGVRLSHVCVYPKRSSRLPFNPQRSTLLNSVSHARRLLYVLRKRTGNAWDCYYPGFSLLPPSYLSMCVSVHADHVCMCYSACSSSGGLAQKTYFPNAKTGQVKKAKLAVFASLTSAPYKAASSYLHYYTEWKLCKKKK